MEVSGKVIKINPLQTGQGRNGEWRKQEFIIETEGQYPKQVCISAWGDKIDQFQLQENQNVNVSINLESREFNGRWYTEVRAWRVDKQGDMASGGAPMPTQEPSAQAGEEDDLPF